MYRKVFGTDAVQRIKDNAFIPPDPNNRDYKEYLLYLKEGGEVSPAEPPIINKDKEINDLFSSPVFSSIIEALAKLTNLNVNDIKDNAKNILNNKVE